MKHFIRFFLVIILATTFIFPQLAFSQESDSMNSITCRVKVKLTDSSPIAWGRLYINGRYRGRVQRSSSRMFNLESGRRYRMVLKRIYRRRHYSWRKTVRIGDSTSSKYVFIHPLRRRIGRRRRGFLVVKMSRRSRIAYGNVYINGRRRGKIRRGRRRVYFLRAGRSYRVSISRRWRGRSYHTSRRVRIFRGRRKRVVLTPRRRRRRRFD